MTQKGRRQPFYFILDSLPAPMNVPYTKFSRNSVKNLNHNASTIKKYIEISAFALVACLP